MITSQKVYKNKTSFSRRLILHAYLHDEEKMLTYKPPSDDEVCLLTLHKSKGLEFKVVFHLDLYKYIMPPEGDNVTDEDYQQMLNLHYVGITRAKEVCYILTGTKRFRARHNDFIDALESPFLYINESNKYREIITLK